MAKIRKAPEGAKPIYLEPRDLTETELMTIENRLYKADQPHADFETRDFIKTVRKLIRRYKEIR